MKYIKIGLPILIAVILIQTLRFKFTAHPHSVYIFTQAGMEPIGRIGIGIMELIAGLLLLYRKTTWVGAVLTIGLMCGAIFMHLTKIGIDVKGDGGVLFYTAIATLFLSVITLILNREKIPFRSTSSAN